MAVEGQAVPICQAVAQFWSWHTATCSATATQLNRCGRSSPTISSSADSVAASSSGSSAEVASGSRGPETTFETPSKTDSHGLVIPTSTDTAFFAANPLRSNASLIAAQLYRVRDVGIGSHIQKLAGETIRSHFQT